MRTQAPVNRSDRRDAFVAQVRGRLIVSCQALAHEPLFGADIMARLAIAAEQGGAAGIRANTPADIRAIRAATALPIIGLYKIDVPGYDVYITPTLAAAREVAAAGADLVSTTMSGYTPYSAQQDGPDIDLVARLAATLTVPLLAEGRYHAPEQVVAALAAGATSVVVGGAITRPQEITRRFVAAIERPQG